MNEFEIKAAKKDLFFNKEDIIRFFKGKLEEVNDEKEKIACENILQKAEKKEFEEFPEDFNNSVIHCYNFSNKKTHRQAYGLNCLLIFYFND